MTKSGPARTGAGRPRRFDDETERRMLIDAAMRVLGRDHTHTLSLDDVLVEADLSTRAFYRHFDSKEALLEALMLLEAATFGRSLSRAVARAADPVSAVEAWLNRYLDVYFQPRRLRRATMLSEATFNGSRPSAQLIREMKVIACSSLVEVLRSGHDAGILYSPTPEADAYSIHDLVAASSYALPIFGHRPVTADEPVLDRNATFEHVVRFAWPALRLDAPHG